MEARESAMEDGGEAEFDATLYNDKIKVDCICPKCGRKHVMAIRWIGRGTPRKFCLSCKNSSGD
jgi:hypothetical protein